MILLSRVDARLLHGQVVEAWAPHLRVQRIAIADDAAARDVFAQTVFRMAVPQGIELIVAAVRVLQYRQMAEDEQRTLLLFRDVQSALTAHEAGLPQGLLHVGNVHAGPGRRAWTRSVFLDDAEEKALVRLGEAGMEILLQATPADKPLPWPR